MTPNQITALRVVLALTAIWLFQASFPARLAAVILTAIVLFLDAVDGYVARRRNMATQIGATIDIVGDRIVENIYLIYFASTGRVPFWMPTLFFLRGAVTDLLRGLAMAEGRTAFGENSMMGTRLGKTLVASRWSRALYGALKCAAFCYLGALGLLGGAAGLLNNASDFMEALDMIASGFAYALTALCLIRGAPVIWEGRRYLREASRKLQPSAGGR